MASINLKDEKYWGKLSSPAYWEKRAKEIDLQNKKTEQEVLKELNNAYKRASDAISADINEFIIKYATDNKIDYTTATQVLTPIEISEYNQRIADLKALYQDSGNERLKREIDKLNARLKVTRLQALNDKINIEMSKLSHEFETTLRDTMTNLVINGHGEVAQLLGVMQPIIHTTALEAIINYPYHGKMFADSVWDNKDALCKWIENELTTAIVRGDSIQKTARRLKKDLGVKYYYQAERLVRTETNYAVNQGHLQGYKDSGVCEKYEILAHLDKRTSKICKGWVECEPKNRTFKLNEAVVGKNYPPFHPNCRTTVMPVVNWEQFGVYF